MSKENLRQRALLDREVAARKVIAAYHFCCPLERGITRHSQFTNYTRSMSNILARPIVEFAYGLLFKLACDLLLKSNVIGQSSDETANDIPWYKAVIVTRSAFHSGNSITLCLFPLLLARLNLHIVLLSFNFFNRRKLLFLCLLWN